MLTLFGLFSAKTRTLLSLKVKRSFYITFFSRLTSTAVYPCNFRYFLSGLQQFGIKIQLVCSNIMPYFEEKKLFLSTRVYIYQWRQYSNAEIINQKTDFAILFYKLCKCVKKLNSIHLAFIMVL